MPNATPDSLRHPGPDRPRGRAVTQETIVRLSVARPIATMAPVLRRLASDYGMLLVLCLLCGAFSVLTLEEQPAIGPDAAARLARTVRRDLPGTPRVLVVVRPRPDEEAFAGIVAGDLAAAGVEVVEVVRGEPAAARSALAGIAAAGERLDAVVGTQATGSWLLFKNLPDEFPTLGRPRVYTPAPFRWPNFLKGDNLLNVANQIAVIAIMAVGMTMVIVAGGIDLSVGSLAALSAVVATRLIRDLAGGTEAAPGGMAAACLAAIVVCTLVGCVTGLVITRCGVPPFIVTLAMMLAASGLASIVAEGESIYQIPQTFVWLGRGHDLGLPNAVLLMLLLYAGAHVVMTRTRFGRYLYAVGGNREAARLSGVRVERVQQAAYAISGLLAGLGGVLMASQLKSGAPTYGAMYELYVIAAVVVGGTALAGGKGQVLGTLVGAFIIAVIQNGMNLMGIESYTQKVVLGLVILAAVLVDRLRHR
jgi:ribose transport system permease protein